MEGLCVNLIFGTRGEAWIYSDHPTGALSIAVSLSARPHFTHILCVPLPHPRQYLCSVDKRMMLLLHAVFMFPVEMHFCFSISPLFTGTDFQA